jgi:hypothetical protein
MQSPNLMLHCGATEVARTDLNLVELPETTRTYCPIGHDTFVDLVEDKLSDVGFRFGTQAHSLTKAGNRYFGLVELLCGQENEQHAMVVGIRNSIDKSFPAAIAFGAQVFVCDNLCFSGEVKVSRKHTTNIMRDLPDLVGAAVMNTEMMRDNQNLRFDCYQDRKIDSRTADHLIIEMLRHGAINTSRVQKIVEQWDNPNHDFGGRSIWRLFNAVTESLKEAPLHDVPPRTILLQAVLDRAAKFVPKAVILPDAIDAEFTVVN